MRAETPAPPRPGSLNFDFEGPARQNPDNNNDAENADASERRLDNNATEVLTEATIRTQWTVLEIATQPLRIG